MFNIAEFKAIVSKQMGFQRPSLFKVTLGVPAGIGAGAGAILPAYLPFYATATNLPGVELQTVDVRRYGYGAVEKKTVVPAFAGLDLVFYADQKGGVLNYFQQWINYIAAFDSSHGMFSANRNGSMPYELQYLQKYAVVAYIWLISPAGAVDTVVTFNQAFPTFIRDSKLEWEDSKSVMKIDVHFAFFDYFQTVGGVGGGGGSTGAGATAFSGIGAQSGGGTITPGGTIGALNSLLAGPSSSIF